MKTIGLVGYGFIGKAHVKAYEQMRNANIKAIYSRTPDKEMMGTYPFVKEFDDLLEDKEIDIIDICLPTFLHEEYIIKAAQAGKHIICEKPLTLAVESANRMIQEVNKHNVRLFVAHVLRFWPEYEVIKSYSEGDELKNIHLVHAKRLGQVPAWSKWFQHPEKSGGALYDLHIHDIDFVIYLLGKVETVYAVGTQNSYGAWDHVMTTLSFENQSKAIIEASQRMPKGYPFTMTLRAQTSESAIDLHISSGENIENLNESTHRFMYYANQQQALVPFEPSDAFQKELSYFVTCVEKDQKNHVIPLEDVVYTLRVLETIQSSLETGCVIKL